MRAKLKFLFMFLGIFLILIICFYFGIIKNTQANVKCIEFTHRFHYEKVGFTGNKSLTFRCFEWLNENASEDLLLNLINDQNSILRSYAYWALIKKKPQETFRLLIDHLEDFDKIEVQDQDITYETTVSDLWIDLSQNYLNMEEKKIIIEKILNDIRYRNLYHYDLYKKKI